MNSRNNQSRRRAGSRSAAVLIIALLSGAGASALRADDADDQPNTNAAGITYVSGGIGSDSILALHAMESQYNLKLVCVDKTGKYLSDVKVTITNGANKVLLNSTTAGPVLMVKLPPGSYQIDASSADEAQHQRAHVGAKPLITVHMRWMKSVVGDAHVGPTPLT